MGGSSRAQEFVAQMPGQAALPRDNGELVFQAPWESRAFGMAVALAERGLYEWSEFQQRLITQIRGWEQRHADGDPAEWNYYRCWLAALEDLLDDKGLCAGDDIAELAADIAARPPEADHHHQ